MEIQVYNASKSTIVIYDIKGKGNREVIMGKEVIRILKAPCV